MTDKDLATRYQHVKSQVPEHVQLIAVSKYTDDQSVETLMAAGHRDFAEAKPQRLRDRALAYPENNWHMIGPLQKNKAKYVGRFAHMWHSMCDLEAAGAVSDAVENRILPVLVQVNISFEPQKQGVSPDDLDIFMKAASALKNLQIIGLMGMAAHDGDAREAFQLLRQCRNALLPSYPEAKHLCMGMSNDWRIAVEEGATMIRVGSEIFGESSTA